MIKNVKIASIFVNEEKEITSKKNGKKYRLCEVNCKVADDSPEYTGKYMRTSIFEYVSADGKKKTTATDKANYFKEQNNGKSVWVDVTERTYVGKDGFDATALDFKTLGKKEIETLTKAGVIK